MPNAIGIGISPVLNEHAVSGDAGVWTPARPTDDGNILPHTWHYASSGALYQDVGKTIPADDDGDLIAVSENQGSDTYDIVQGGSPTIRPTFKLNIVNGQPVMRFDGSGDYMRGAFSGALSQPFTAFSVAILDAAAIQDNNYHGVMDGDDGTKRMYFPYQEGGAGIDNWSMFSGSVLESATATTNAWFIWTGLFNGASSQFWSNGTSLKTGNAGTQSPDGLTLGAQFDNAAVSLWDGDIAELLIYNSNLSIADKNQVGQYLADKYGLTWIDIT